MLTNFEQKYKEKPAHTADDHNEMYKALNLFDGSCEGVTLYDIDKMKQVAKEYACEELKEEL